MKGVRVYRFSDGRGFTLDGYYWRVFRWNYQDAARNEAARRRSYEKET